MDEFPQLFTSIWGRVRAAYVRGSCVSERGLQALLYCELAKALPESTVVVEPSWFMENGRCVPDLVIVKNGEITDVFEIKFVPHGFADLKGDIRKLLAYGNPLHDSGIAIDPLTGKWRNPAKASPNIRRHFVAIANREAAAVWPASVSEEVPELKENFGKIWHWYARIDAKNIEDQEWAIQFGI
jgi:hypothetical protein